MWFKGSDQQESKRVWSNINTRYTLYGGVVMGEVVAKKWALNWKTCLFVEEEDEWGGGKEGSVDTYT